jgi:hypothetical protein
MEETARLNDDGRKLNRLRVFGVTIQVLRRIGMKNTVMALLAVGASALVWMGVAAQQQEMLPKPGPGSGVIDVRGTVSVAGISEVRLAGVPDVNVLHMPEVRIAAVPPAATTAPAFLRRGGRYVVTWATGERESITVTEVAQGGGWVQVGSSRWLNFHTARAVEREP